MLVARAVAQGAVDRGGRERIENGVAADQKAAGVIAVLVLDLISRRKSERVDRGNVAEIVLAAGQRRLEQLVGIVLGRSVLDDVARGRNLTKQIAIAVLLDDDIDASAVELSRRYIQRVRTSGRPVADDHGGIDQTDAACRCRRAECESIDVGPSARIRQRLLKRRAEIDIDCRHDFPHFARLKCAAAMVASACTFDPSTRRYLIGES